MAPVDVTGGQNLILLAEPGCRLGIPAQLEEFNRGCYFSAKFVKSISHALILPASTTGVYRQMSMQGIQRTSVRKRIAPRAPAAPSGGSSPGLQYPVR